MSVENEDQYADLFATAAADLCPPIAQMLEYSMAEGARARRRRNCRSVVGGTGALVATLAVTLVLSRGGVGAGPVSATGSGVSGPAGISGPAAAADYRILSSLLSGGSVAEAPGGPAPGAEVAVDYNDGHGMSAVEISHRLYSTAMPAAAGESCDGSAGSADSDLRPSSAPPTGCTAATLPDGSTEVEIVGGMDRDGVYDIELELFRLDGVEVVVTEANGVETGGSSKMTRGVPPLTFSQLTTIAADPRW